MLAFFLCNLYLLCWLFCCLFSCLSSVFVLFFVVVMLFLKDVTYKVAHFRIGLGSGADEQAMMDHVGGGVDLALDVLDDLGSDLFEFLEFLCVLLGGMGQLLR